MTRKLIGAVAVVLFAGLAQAGGKGGGKAGGDGGGKTVHVSGYTRKDGTYVAPYDRRPPGTAGPRVSPPPAEPRTTPRTTAPGGRRTSYRGQPAGPAEAAALKEPPAGAGESVPAAAGNPVVVIGRMTAEVEVARVGPALFGKQFTRDKYLTVRLKLTADAGGVPYTSWGYGKPVLKDSKGRELKYHATDADGSEPPGRYTGTGTTVGGIRDVLIFDAPAADAESVTLELPADFARKGDAFIFEIPAAFIKY